jgi:hypothetical protein
MLFRWVFVGVPQSKAACTHECICLGVIVSVGKTTSNRLAYQLLHQLLMHASASHVVDHINHDPCNNQRNNLRVATRSQNKQNRVKRAVSTRMG